MPIASAQVKSAILLAGLLPRASLRLSSPRPAATTPNECLNTSWSIYGERRPGRTVTAKSHECRVSMLGQQQIESRDFAVPGDISSAAFWLVAAACQPGSRLLVKNVGLNPTRTGILDVLVRMGARVREVVESIEEGEPVRCDRHQGRSAHGNRH